MILLPADLSMFVLFCSLGLSPSACPGPPGLVYHPLIAHGSIRPIEYVFHSDANHTEYPYYDLCLLTSMFQFVLCVFVSKFVSICFFFTSCLLHITIVIFVYLFPTQVSVFLIFFPLLFHNCSVCVFVSCVHLSYSLRILISPLFCLYLSTTHLISFTILR